MSLNDLTEMGGVFLLLSAVHFKYLSLGREDVMSLGYNRFRQSIRLMLLLLAGFGYHWNTWKLPNTPLILHSWANQPLLFPQALPFPSTWLFINPAIGQPYSFPCVSGSYEFKKVHKGVISLGQW